MDFKALAMGLAFAFMWSSAFTSARMIVVDAPPLYALTLRFLISGTIAIAIARAMGQSWRLTPAQWRATLIFGVCQNAAYLGLNFVAMQTVEASIASIIASTMPLIVALMGGLFLGDRLKPLAVAGMVAGFGGVLIIMGARFSGDMDFVGLGLCVIAAIALAVATLMVRGASSGGNVMMIVGLQMLIGSATLTLPALLTEDLVVNVTPRLILAFAYTTLVPGLAATWVWFLLVQRIGAIRGATFHFLNPFFGVAVAAVFLGESLGLGDVIGVAIIMAGILAVQLSKAAPAKPKSGSAPAA
ncbi:MAG: DMT family transporter [Paracoccaceae bacterium]